MSVTINTGTSQGSLPDFLASAKRTLSHAIQNKDKVTLVIGNEDADTDSVVSAILFSYLRSASPPTKAFTKTYVPLAQLSEAEIGSRSSLSRLLEQTGLKASDLVTLEDILKSGESTRSGLVADNTRIFLVGQNKLVGRMGENYSKNIIGCIDHHPEENYVPKETDPEPRIIGKSATSTSLVVNHSSSAWGALKGERAAWDSQIAKLALGTILLDTEDMRTGGRFTEEDERAVKFLESKISGGSNSGAFDRSSFYQALTGFSSRTRPSTTATTAPTNTTAPTTTTAPATTHAPTTTPRQETSSAVPVVAGTATGGFAAQSIAAHATEPSFSTVQIHGNTDLKDLVSSDRDELYDWLERGFEKFPSGHGVLVGLSTIDRPLGDLIDQSEHDIAHQALRKLNMGDGSNKSASTGHSESAEVKTGSPFTSIVRDFATSKGCSIFGLLTTNHDSSSKGYDSEKRHAAMGTTSSTSITTNDPNTGRQSTGGIASTISSFFGGGGRSSTTAPTSETANTSTAATTGSDPTTTSSQRTEHDPAATTAFTNPTSAAEESSLLTGTGPGRKELFLWVMDPKLGAAMPAFIDGFSEALNLSKWEGDHEVVKEMGMYDGLMRVYWIGAKGVSGEVVAGMLGESLTAGDGTFVGKGL